MSGYTIGEILIWLVAAAVLGFLLGWLCRELVGRRRRPAAPVAEPAVQSMVEPVAEPLAEPVVPATPRPEPVVVPGPHPGSALPLAGGEPPSAAYVVKVSRGSKIYHAPSSPAYGRTTAALWFETPEAAEAAGFRRPKNA
ncbi:MAG: hypothetical protein JWR55_1237 [Aeromicrobium sp.]|jgi:hypothetical protein|nr:hypothetical protein [Aeromicrobium sp.]